VFSHEVQVAAVLVALQAIVSAASQRSNCENSRKTSNIPYCTSNALSNSGAKLKQQKSHLTLPLMAGGSWRVPALDLRQLISKGFLQLKEDQKLDCFLPRKVALT
jgi:hypothetical protein